MKDPNFIKEYSKSNKFKFVIIYTLIAVTLISFLIDIAVGPSSYTLGEVIKTLFNPKAVSPQLEVILWDLRLPIAIMALLIGIMLALSGAQMQTILNNPLAEPFILGIASAASFGAAFAIVLGKGLISVPGYLLVLTNAFIFAMLSALVIYFLSSFKKSSVQTIILIGIATLFFFQALLALLQYYADETSLTQLVFWMMGSLGKANWIKISICIGVLLISILIFSRYLSKVASLRLGDEKAKSLGVKVENLRLFILIIITLLTSVAVSFVGIVAFIGLIAPHIARMILGEEQKSFLILSAIIGAFLMSLTSIISKTIIPGVIFPIGIITALIGIPFFALLILTTNKTYFK